MSYQLAQITVSNNTDVFVDNKDKPEITIGTVQDWTNSIVTDDTRTFENTCVNYKFENDKIYYVSFDMNPNIIDINGVEGVYDITFTPYLVNIEDGKIKTTKNNAQVLNASYTVSFGKDADGNYISVPVDYIFKVNSKLGPFNAIVFDIDLRLPIDYQLTGEGKLRKVEFVDDVVRIEEVKNLLPNEATRVGIRGLANTVFSLNGEKMKLNRNGVFEIDFPGFTIKEIGFVETPNEDIYIDYIYDNKGGSN